MYITLIQENVKTAKSFIGIPLSEDADNIVTVFY